jgi:Zn-dependent protease
MVAHEYAHGYAALKQGDDTALVLGRLTFNPLKHIDPWMTILMPALLWFGSGGRFIFGGAKPIPVDPRKFKNYKRGDVIVSSAGIVANLFLFVIFSLVSVAIGVIGQAFETAPTLLVLCQRMMFWGIWLNVLLAFFNLIPIPPLDGSHLLFHALPPKIAASYRQAGRYGMFIIMIIFLWFPRILPVLLFPALLLARWSFELVHPFALGPFMLMPR